MCGLCYGVQWKFLLGGNVHLLGFLSSGVSLVVAMVYLVLKLLHWHSFNAGNAPLLIGVYVIGSLQLFFIGLLGEYILNINTRVIHRPLVVEEKRLNFEDDK